MSDVGPVDLWTFFQAAGGVAALGYPVSSQWSKGPFTLQTFQKAAIQWSESGGFQYVNIYDKLPAVDRQARFEDAATTFDRLAGLIRGRVPPAALAELPPLLVESAAARLDAARLGRIRRPL